MSVMETTYCPICNNVMLKSDRYPNALCKKHYGECLDKDGNVVTYGNTSLGGGFASYHTVNNTIIKKDDGICFIRGHKCTVGEAHLGEIVIQLLK
jgi:hypothetical protein